MLKHLALALLVASCFAEDDSTCVDKTTPPPAIVLAVVGQAAHTQDFDQYRLSYFDGRGLAEIPRTLFATAGLFPGSGFEDVRMTRPEFDAAKAKGDLGTNLGRVPVLNHNGAVIGQSNAISRYLARRFGLMGNGGNEVEAAQIDALTEHIIDIKGGYRKLFPYGKKLAPEEAESNSNIWFDTPPTPALEGRAERQLQWFLGSVEDNLPDTTASPSGSVQGYSVGRRPSLADACLFNLLGEHAPEVEDKTRGEPFGSLARTNAALQAFPKLRAVVDTFRNSPGMQHYLRVRGDGGKVKW